MPRKNSPVGGYCHATINGTLTRFLYQHKLQLHPGLTTKEKGHHSVSSRRQCAWMGSRDAPSGLSTLAGVINSMSSVNEGPGRNEAGANEPSTHLAVMEDRQSRRQSARTVSSPTSIEAAEAKSGTFSLEDTDGTSSMTDDEEGNEGHQETEDDQSHSNAASHELLTPKPQRQSWQGGHTSPASLWTDIKPVTAIRARHKDTSPKLQTKLGREHRADTISSSAPSTSGHRLSWQNGFNAASNSPRSSLDDKIKHEMIPEKGGVKQHRRKTYAAGDGLRYDGRHIVHDGETNGQVSERSAASDRRRQTRSESFSNAPWLQPKSTVSDEENGADDNAHPLDLPERSFHYPDDSSDDYSDDNADADESIPSSAIPRYPSHTSEDHRTSKTAHAIMAAVVDHKLDSRVHTDSPPYLSVRSTKSSTRAGHPLRTVSDFISSPSSSSALSSMMQPISPVVSGPYVNRQPRSRQATGGTSGTGTPSHPSRTTSLGYVDTENVSSTSGHDRTPVATAVFPPLLSEGGPMLPHPLQPQHLHTSNAQSPHGSPRPSILSKKRSATSYVHDQFHASPQVQPAPRSRLSSNTKLDSSLLPNPGERNIVSPRKRAKSAMYPSDRLPGSLATSPEFQRVASSTGISRSSGSQDMLAKSASPVGRSFSSQAMSAQRPRTDSMQSQGRRMSYRQQQKQPELPLVKYDFPLQVEKNEASPDTPLLSPRAEIPPSQSLGMLAVSQGSLSRSPMSIADLLAADGRSGGPSTYASPSKSQTQTASGPSLQQLLEQVDVRASLALVQEMQGTVGTNTALNLARNRQSVILSNVSPKRAMTPKEQRIESRPSSVDFSEARSLIGSIQSGPSAGPSATTTTATPLLTQQRAQKQVPPERPSSPSILSNTGSSPEKRKHRLSMQMFKFGISKEKKGSKGTDVALQRSSPDKALGQSVIHTSRPSMDGSSTISDSAHGTVNELSPAAIQFATEVKMELEARYLPIYTALAAGRKPPSPLGVARWRAKQAEHARRIRVLNHTKSLETPSLSPRNSLDTPFEFDDRAPSSSLTDRLRPKGRRQSPWEVAPRDFAAFTVTGGALPDEYSIRLNNSVSTLNNINGSRKGPIDIVSGSMGSHGSGHRLASSSASRQSLAYSPASDGGQLNGSTSQSHFAPNEQMRRASFGSGNYTSINRSTSIRSGYSSSIRLESPSNAVATSRENRPRQRLADLKMQSYYYDANNSLLPSSPEQEHPSHQHRPILRRQQTSQSSFGQRGHHTSRQSDHTPLAVESADERTPLPGPGLGAPELKRSMTDKIMNFPKNYFDMINSYGDGHAHAIRESGGWSPDDTRRPSMSGRSSRAGSLANISRIIGAPRRSTRRSGNDTDGYKSTDNEGAISDQGQSWSIRPRSRWRSSMQAVSGTLATSTRSGDESLVERKTHSRTNGQTTLDDSVFEIPHRHRNLAITDVEDGDYQAASE